MILFHYCESANFLDPARHLNDDRDLFFESPGVVFVDAVFETVLELPNGAGDPENGGGEWKTYPGSKETT